MNLISAPRLAVVVLAHALVLALAACGTEQPTRSDPPRKDVEKVEHPRTAPMRPGRPLDDTPSPFDLDDPQVSRLDPQLLKAVQAAARDAGADGVRFWITSGWRSRAKQQALFDAAVVKYRSVEEARRYVSTPDKSAHVTGDAVDIGPTEADSWLAQHGSDYGLCQSFANEIWHFELAVEPGGTCPAPIPDSSYR
ncbi:M15 family metallopeptidase [Nocardioides marmoriginsengisoli]|uniref:M15 family metallopeptidase n=1 Tax=Nocardioides marmoriginsengisoli TaxID=661483 RepID=UPI001C82AA18|nr:M15 family metallopeptidase [Nocardioides marmoriginsengisoli]